MFAPRVYRLRGFWTRETRFTLSRSVPATQDFAIRATQRLLGYQADESEARSGKCLMASLQGPLPRYVQSSLAADSGLVNHIVSGP